MHPVIARRAARLAALVCGLIGRRARAIAAASIPMSHLTMTLIQPLKISIQSTRFELMNSV